MGACRTFVVLTVVAALAATACTSDRPDETTPGGKSSADPTPREPVEVPAPVQISSEDAISIEKTNPLDGDELLPVDTERAGTPTVGSSGDVLLQMGLSRHNGRKGSGRQGKLVVMDLESGDRQVVRRMKDTRQHTRTWFAALDDDYAVWTEQTSSTLAVSDWTMYAANRDTGKTSEVARAQPVDESGATPTVPGYTIPRLHDGSVYWTEARANPGSKKGPALGIYARDLDSGGPVERIVSNAIMPIATGTATENWLYYVGFEPDRVDERAYGIYRMDLDTGKRTAIYESAGGSKDAPGRPGFLTAYGNVSAWSFQRKLRIFHGTEPMVDIHAPNYELLGWPSAGPGLIGFADNGGLRPGRNGGNYLFDLGSKRLYNLGRAMGGAEVKIGGNRVLWGMEDPSRKDEPGAPIQWHYGTVR